MTIAATLTAQGVGAQGLVTSAPIGGTLDIGSAITTTGYRSTSRADAAVDAGHVSVDEVEQGGSGVVVGGSVARGINIAGP